MSKKMYIVGALITVIAVLLIAQFWFINPMGFSKMGSGYNSAWNLLSWSWMLFSGFIRLLFWFVPVLVVAWLVSSLFHPAAPQKVDQVDQGGE